jgi:hypothetical protein
VEEKFRGKGYASTMLSLFNKLARTQGRQEKGEGE